MKYKSYFTFLTLLLVLLFVLDILIGAVKIPISEFVAYLHGDDISISSSIIISDFRIPKAFTAILCGSSLALSGLLMQTLFRNPLAGPYILGISSGAGLGVALLVMGAGVIGIGVLSSLSLSLGALLGAILVLLVLFLVSLKVSDIMTLLIFGVMIGSIATAIISLIQFYTNDFQLKSFIIWTMGSLAAVKTSELLVLFSVLSVGSLLCFTQAKGLNALLIGSDFAKNLGISTKSLKIIILLISGSLAGLCTAFCGPIGFVGIVIPHFSRLLFKTNNHFIIIPASLLLGANILLLSDIISNIPSNGLQLPINSITSILGVPFILWIVFSKKMISKTI